MNLTDFLLARIAEDQAVARGAMPGPWFDIPRHDLWRNPIVCESHWPGLTQEESDEYGDMPPGPPNYVVAQTMNGSTREPDAVHIARWDPVRVLAECEAKRRIVEGIRDATAGPVTEYHIGPVMTTDHVLAFLAEPYATHPDYREEWRP